MGEYTNILDTDIGFDLINTSFVIVSAILVLGMIFYGGNKPDFGMLAIGLSMGFGLLLGMAFLGYRVLDSPASPLEGAVHVIMGYVIGLFAGAGGSFSVYDPEQSIYSGFVSEAPENVQMILHTWLAPYIENLAILGIIIVLYHSLQEAGLGKTSSLIISVFVGSVVFAVIHWGRDFSFLVRAFLFIAVLSAMLVAAADGLISSKFFPATIGGLFGVHRQANINEFGGWLNVYDVLLTAEMPELILSYVVLASDLMIFGIAFAAILWGGIPFIKDLVS